MSQVEAQVKLLEVVLDVESHQTSALLRSTTAVLIGENKADNQFYDELTGRRL